MLIVVFGAEVTRADPAVRRRRVHRVHAVARPAWSPPPARCASRSWQRGLVDQRRRLRRHRHRADRRRGLEVHRGRVDPGGRDPGDRRALPGASTATTSGSTRRSPAPTTTRSGAAPTPSSCSSAGCTKGVLEALAYARSLRPDRLIAVSVVSNAEEQERIIGEWEDHDIPVELRTSTRRTASCTRPIMRFIDELDAETPTTSSPSSIPEFVARPLVGAAAAQPERARPAGPAARPGRTRSSRRCRSTSVATRWRWSADRVTVPHISLGRWRRPRAVSSR